ncbi:DUF1349 domain-containing protein [Deinococcus sp.]|uniref:DUF1349 domain-containing protein n=1 Tax=Deinococcus sp. TaxID=47478 RepID=UPI002869CD46|nr:DUF1349 domain-containing protein [Deinococcus sp.]
MPPDTHIPGVPFALTPSPDTEWAVDTSGHVEVTATPHSDIFVDPGGSGQVNAQTLLNAATLLGDAPPGDFTFHARVSVDFASTFDAGVLLLWFDERHWAKLCFEFSPDRDPMVVSVVNRGVADDANSFVVKEDAVWLRVSRVDAVFAYHASTDGTRWQFVRAFVLDGSEAALKVGFEAQSPTGEGCRVRFTQVAFTDRRLSDLRDGS